MNKKSDMGISTVAEKAFKKKNSQQTRNRKELLNLIMKSTKGLPLTSY